MSDVIVKGLPELREKFRQISAEVGTKALRRGAAAGGVLLRDAIKAAAPIRKDKKRYGRFVVPPGTLRAAALVKYAREESNATQSFYVVTFRQGKRYQNSGRDAYYARWVERGHLIVPRASKTPTYLKKNSITARRKAAAVANKRVPGLYFMARATEANVQRAADRMVSVMDATIRKIDGIS
jgi:hypothetical protein